MELKSNEIRRIRVEDIQPNPLNPRRKISREEIESLAQNIKAVGLLQPITVRMKIETVDGLPEGDWYYEIVCGHRRFEACKVAGLTEIDCIVRDLSDDEAYDLMVTENLQRVDVDPFDESEAFVNLRKRGYDTEALAAKFGKSSTYILSRMKVSELIPEFRKKYDEGKVDFSHCLVLARLDRDFQKKMVSRYEDNAGYYSLLGKTTAELRTAIKSSGNLLSTAPFDTSLCKSCPKNTECGSVFLDTEEAVCEDADCFNGKIVEEYMPRFEEARRRNPEFFICDDWNLKHLNVVWEEMLADRLREAGFSFKGYDAWKCDAPQGAKRKYEIGSGDVTCFSFAEGFRGPERKRDGNSPSSNKWKSEWTLDSMANHREDKLQEMMDDIASERIAGLPVEEMAEAQNSPVELFKAALLSIVEAWPDYDVEEFGLKGDMDNAADVIDALNPLQLGMALAKYIAMVSVDKTFIRRMFPQQFEITAEEARARFMEEARGCWHGYDEVTDEMIEEDLAKRVKKED